MICVQQEIHITATFAIRGTSAATVSTDPLETRHPVILASGRSPKRITMAEYYITEQQRASGSPYCNVM